MWPGEDKKRKRKNRKVEIEKVLTLTAKCYFLRLASPCVSLRLSIPDLLFGSVGGLSLSIHFTVFMSFGSLIPNIKQ